MTHPVYIGMRQVAACTTPEAQAAAMRLLGGTIEPSRARMYCFMIGRGVDADANGDCPECGEYGRDHHHIPNDECWAFVDCGGECGEKGGCGKGHPCRLPPDHEGQHVAKREEKREEGR